MLPDKIRSGLWSFSKKIIERWVFPDLGTKPEDIQRAERIMRYSKEPKLWWRQRRLLKAARTLGKTGHKRRAVERLERFLVAYPRHGHAWLTLAQLKKPAEAGPAYQMAWAHGGRLDRWIAAMRMGEDAVLKRNAPAQVLWFERAWRLWPFSSFVATQLVQAYVAQKETEKAQAFFKRIRWLMRESDRWTCELLLMPRLTPSANTKTRITQKEAASKQSPSMLLKTGRTLLRGGDKLGLELIELALAQAPERADGWLLLLGHGTEAQRDQAVAMIERYGNTGQQVAALSQRAQQMEAARRNDSAWQLTARAVALAPDDAMLRLKLIRRLLTAQEATAALSEIETHRHSLPAEHLPALEARALLLLGRVEEVLTIIVTARQQLPESETLIDLHIQTLERLGRLEEARTLITTEGQYLPPARLLRLGDKMGLSDRQMRELAEATLADQPNAIVALQTLSQIMSRSRDHHGALGILERIITLAPEDGGSWLRAAQAVRQLDDDRLRAIWTERVQAAVASGQLDQGVAVRAYALLGRREAAFDLADSELAKGRSSRDLVLGVFALADYQRTQRALAMVDEGTRASMPEVAATLVAAARLNPELPRDEAEAITQLSLPGIMPDVVAGRVLHLGGSLNTGGAERQLVQMLSHLHGGAYDLHLGLLNSQPTELTHRLEQTTVPIHGLDQLAEAGLVRDLMAEDPNAAAVIRQIEALPPAIATEVTRAYALIRQLRPAVVMCWQDRINMVGGLAAAMAGVPRIVLSARREVRKTMRAYRHGLRAAYRQLLAREGVTLICNSAMGARSYEAWLGMTTGQALTVPNGYDFDEILRRKANGPSAASLRAEVGIPTDAVVVGIVARLVPVKRHDQWLRMLAALLPSHPNLYAMAMGGGMLIEELRAQVAELGMACRVHFVGEKHPVEPWMAACDVITLTSQSEGLPNVLIEAQALGLPVASTDVGGALETFAPGESGIVLPGDDPADWAAALAPLLTDPDRRKQMAAAAQTHALDRFEQGRVFGGLSTLWATTPR